MSVISMTEEMTNVGPIGQMNQMDLQDHYLEEDNALLERVPWAMMKEKILSYYIRKRSNKLRNIVMNLIEYDHGIVQN